MRDLITYPCNVRVTRWPIKQKVRRHPVKTRLRLIVGIWFQVLFHSPSGVLFTFPSRYWYTIGHTGVFSLRRWSSQIQTGFLVSRHTWDSDKRPFVFAYGAFTLCGSPFQGDSTNNWFCNSLEVPPNSPSDPATPALQRRQA